MGSPVLKRGEIISQDIRDTISKRYRTVTRAINKEFWNSQSDTQHSLYVGSYGRGTAIDTSDLDILVELPQRNFNQYDSIKGNGQSRLLQAVRNAILVSYPRSDVRADGQVVKISFNDGMRFEILPAFKNLDCLGQWDGTYTYPDTNMGGNWFEHHPCFELFYRNTGGFLFGKPCNARLSAFLCTSNAYQETSKLQRCFQMPTSLYEHDFSI